jgi:hypothetical protein
LPKRTLVLANDQQEGLAHLSHSYEEARAVASLFNTQPLLGDAATASVLRTTAGNCDILHLIAHMDHDSQDPQFSSVMTGLGRVGDGPLELHQVLLMYGCSANIKSPTKRPYRPHGVGGRQYGGSEDIETLQGQNNANPQAVLIATARATQAAKVPPVVSSVAMVWAAVTPAVLSSTRTDVTGV